MSDTQAIRSLTLPEVLTIHELIVERFGGLRGITEQGFGRVEAAVAAPEASMFGEDLYAGLAAKAGVLFWRLVRAHGFSDGNKRVALLGLLLYLELHGARLRAGDDELYDLTMGVATDTSQEQTAAWIEARLERTDG
jgi:death on curing protein